MVRYYFHTESGGVSLDDEGMDLSGYDEARVEAARMLGEMLKDDAHQFWSKRSMRLIVTDESGLILFALDISGVEAPALSRERRPRPAA